jgi:hypothetical protein
MIKPDIRAASNIGQSDEWSDGALRWGLAEHFQAHENRNIQRLDHELFLELAAEAFDAFSIYAEVRVADAGGGANLDDAVGFDQKFNVVHETKPLAAKLGIQIIILGGDDRDALLAGQDLFQIGHGRGRRGPVAQRRDGMRRVGALAADAVGGRRTRRQPAIFDAEAGGTGRAGSEHKESEEQQGCNQQRDTDNASGHLLMMPHFYLTQSRKAAKAQRENNS